MDPKKNRGNLKALPYAVWEGDCWFAAIKFELRDAPIGQDVILRKIPCLTQRLLVVFFPFSRSSVDKRQR